MRRRRLGWSGATLAAVVASSVFLAAAALGQPPSSDPIGDLIVQSPGAGDSRGFENGYLAPLKRASCSAGVKRLDPKTLDLAVSSVPLAGLNPFRKEVGSLSFVAGFHLTSTDKRLGGLSGLDMREDGGLLAVSDTGDFVWIDLAADGLTPKALRVAAMLDAKGAALRGKAEGDAEGLALRGDIALVSYEGHHRVLAFDLGACGAAARGAPVASASSTSLTRAFERKDLSVGGNQGLEGLAITADWMLIAGIETKLGSASPVSARPIEASPEFDLEIGKDAPELVGLDALPAEPDGGIRLYSLHRSSNPLASNVITIVESTLEPTFDQSNLPARVISEIDERSRKGYRVTSSRALAEMSVFLTIDNFEGIAARRLPDGRVRLFVVSDDNFSESQRTLLMIYDVRS